jgi:hypothetical protein
LVEVVAGLGLRLALHRLSAQLGDLPMHPGRPRSQVDVLPAQPDRVPLEY